MHILTHVPFNTGDPSLVSALSKHYSPLVGREIDAINEVAVTVGATEAIFSIMQAFIEVFTNVYMNIYMYMLILS